MSTNTSVIALANKIKEVCLSGYDIYFLHGWVTAASSAPNEIDEDDIAPTYLLFQNPEAMFKVENLEGFMQELNEFCNNIVETTLGSTDPITPMVNLQQTAVDFEKLTSEEERNLLSWIYGYLFSYLANWDNVADYCEDQDLMPELFFAPLLHLSAAFLILDKEYNLVNDFSEDAQSDFADLKMDIYDLWEDKDGGNLLSDEKLAELEGNKLLVISDVGNVTSMLLNFVLDHCIDDATADNNTLN